jgi:hypothetical protein
LLGVHRRADGEPGDHPAARHEVERRRLLGDAHGRVVEGDRVAKVSSIAFVRGASAAAIRFGDGIVP